MEIGGNNSKYPGGALSNFTARSFIFDDVKCCSIEGVLQAFKSPYPHIQKEICLLVGYGAKKRGSIIDWKKKQTLYWQGKTFKRDSDEYQNLLDRLYENVYFQDEKFKKALQDTGNAVFSHSIGKSKIQDTVLTIQEFLSRLTKLRDNGYLIVEDF